MDIEKYKDKKPFIKKREDGQSGSGYTWDVHYWNFSGGGFNLYLAATYQYAKMIYKGYLDEFNIQIDKLENPEKYKSKNFGLYDLTFRFENFTWNMPIIPVALTPSVITANQTITANEINLPTTILPDIDSDE